MRAQTGDFALSRRVVFTLLLLLLLLLSPTALLAQDDPADIDATGATPGAIVISEIHYDPADKRARVEFVELYNPSSAVVDLSGWAFTAGIRYEFAAGVTLAPGRYLAIAADPARVWEMYRAPALGPFSGRLANEGELLELRNSRAEVVDSVEYGVGFPWPLGGGDYDLSIGLLYAALDNNIPGAWRASGATPGAGNNAWLDNPPPFIDAVEHLPAAPTAFDPVQIRAQIRDADGVASVRLLLQAVAPGAYIRLTDPAYSANWIAVPMQAIGPDLYAAEVPAHMRVHRHLIRYRIEATDQGGRTVTAPYWEDPQPNFALYVYNGAPAWGGAIRPGGAGSSGVWQSYAFDQMRPVAVYQLLAAASDVADAQHIPPSTRPSYMGNDYPWLGTLVYNGVVYDHIGFRARGGLHRYATGKNNWKFNFRRGHRFQAYDDYGVPYPVKWDKLVFSSVLQHANRRYRGEQGLFETLAYRLYNLADVPASATHFVHFRVVDQPVEQSGSQYNGDFWGLYLALENVDGQFLDQHNLPDGNLYEMKGATGELDNEGEEGVADKYDLIAFMNGYLYGNPDTTWWRTNFDLAGYFSFRSITEAIHNYDIGEGKNYYYYLNPETRRWSIFPWDLDLTWAETFSGAGVEPFLAPVLGRPEFQLEYQNRLRELRDLLFTPDQLYPMIDETAALIDAPASGLSMVDADRAQWDYNPILTSPYVDGDRARVGQFYQIAPGNNFRGMVQLLRDYVLRRAAWIDATLLTDRDHPFTPGVWYAGPADYPADQLLFYASGFADPQGAHTFAAMQWRVAELNYPGIPGYDPSQRGRYEIEATWTSAALTDYASRMTLPPGVCMPGATCRVRVRMQDQSGRWSHWSAPLQFVAGAPGAPAQGLVISELMYHPENAGAIPADQLEFVELRNSSATSLDLSGARFASAIDFTFPTDTMLAPGSHLVLAADAQAFAARYGFPPFGAFARNLRNSGEQIVVLDVFGRTLVDLTYGDAGEWPASADGDGHSLVLRNPAAPGDVNNPTAWRASQGRGGSPGADDPEAVVVNEVIFRRTSGRISQVELYNPGPVVADVSHWILTAAPLANDWRWQPPPAGLRVAAGATIPPGGYLLVAVPPGQIPLDNSGEWTLTLLSATGEERLTGYAAPARLQPPANASAAVGRILTAQGSIHYAPVRAATPGQANAAPQIGPVVISRVMVHPADKNQWIELTNLTGQPVPLYDPQAPTRTWMIGGAFMRLPSGIVLPPHGSLWVAGRDPAALCLARMAPPGVRVTGPFALPLSDRQLRLTLLQPVSWGAGWIDAVVDVVASDAHWSLPGSLNPVWQRNPVDGFGPDASNWQVTLAPEPAGDAAVPGELCLFEAAPADSDTIVVRWIVAHDPAVHNFVLTSTDAARAIPETTTIPVGEGLNAGEMVTYAWRDTTVQTGGDRFYWLGAQYEDGVLHETGMTNLLTRYRLTHLPLVAR
jgi:hypothetical protein